MKLINHKLLTSLGAIALGTSLLVACGDDPVDNDGNGGEGGAATGGSSDGSGGEDSTGGTGGGDPSTGGSDVGGQGGEGGEGTGGGPIVDPVAEITTQAAFLLDNAINVYGTLVASNGKIYVSGVTDISAVNVAQADGNLRLAVWRFNANGSLDTAWGDDDPLDGGTLRTGKLTSSIVNPGTSYDILELADGNFVVQYSGTAGPALVKLSSDGVFGTPVALEFGWSAAQRTDLNGLCVAAAATAECVDANPATVGSDCATPVVDQTACDAARAACTATTEAVACQAAWPAATIPLFTQRPAVPTSWGIGLDSSTTTEKIVVFAHGPAAKVSSGVQRTDNDRYINRVFAADFLQDGGFNGGKAFTHDVSNAKLSDGTRRGIVLADGKILSSGYTNMGTGKGNHIAVIKLLADGTLDQDFGFSDDPVTFPIVYGQTLTNPFLNLSPSPSTTPGAAEAYGVAVLSNGNVVTTGYGSSYYDVGTTAPDLVVTSFDNEGLDPAYGGNKDGLHKGAYGVQSEADTSPGVGLSASPYEDRGRHIASLTDDRTVHAGAYDGRAAIHVLTANGRSDTTVGGTGRLVFAYEGNLFGLAVSEDGLAIVATSTTRAKVVGTSLQNSRYAKTMVALVQVEDLDE